MKQSSRVIGKICASESTFARMLACEIITPFGTPVLPLEKMTVASDLDVRSRPPYARRSHATGASLASMSAAILAATPTVLVRSSRNTMPTVSGIDALLRNRLDVTIVRIPLSATAVAIASGPAVKLRFTGTLPAVRTPMFARAPPTDAGSKTPTIVSSPARRPITRPRRIAATSARPYVSFWPRLSAIGQPCPVALGIAHESRLQEIGRLPPVAHRLGAKFHDR